MRPFLSLRCAQSWLLLAMFSTASTAGVLAGEGAPPPAALDAAVLARLEGAIDASVDPNVSFETGRKAWEQIATDSWASAGSGAVIERLKAVAADEVAGAKRRFGSARGLAYVLFQEGRIDEALASVDQALAIQRLPDLAFLRARLLDALDRVDEAIVAYRAASEATIDPSIRDRIALRLALLDAMRPNTNDAPQPDDSSPAPASDATESALFRLANQESATIDFANRAAVVLALLGRPREAISLYSARGEGSDRFKQEVRLAEWALAAKSPKEAQEHAWSAKVAAQLRRDRTYALTLLVEAHRADSTLDTLIDRLAAEPTLDAESRRVWIDLLRETSRVDEALALFADSRDESGGFTVDMRRDLLEMCREAGRDSEVVRTYREMIESEPHVIEWREGLARHHLERGQRAEAEALWTEHAARANTAAQKLQGARAAADLGLEEVARAISAACLADPEGRLDAHRFRFDLELRAGRPAEAEAELDAFDRASAKDDPRRIELAEAYERLGNQARAAAVLEALRDARGGDFVEEDLDMRLAWLLSETGQEEKAYVRWKELWARVSTIPRRRQVEDRLMSVASRLGVLADLAIELEEMLYDGKADERRAGLLIRLYQKVGDPVSAAEVTDEFLKRKGADEAEVLREKARVYLGGKDYFNFERTTRKLIEVDPENRGDHLRQLAMSNLERGRPQEARAVLLDLAKIETDTDAMEFEAGVLALAGQNAEAADVYRRGLAVRPERIDSWLLYANTQRALGRGANATGMFQHMIEFAEKDDLFTIAVDGVLNMRAERPRLRHTLRVILERLADRHDKMYLYQLASDLAEEMEDRSLRMRALECSLAIAAEQRAQVLRELMEIAQGAEQNSYTIVNGRLVRQRTGGDDARRLAYGRRLIGLGDIVPPQVYLELGTAFLRSGDVASAAKTFSLARDVPDRGSFERQIASTFESEKFVEDALTVYERAMASQAIDVSLLVKIGRLHETLGRDARASEMFRRGIELLLARHPLVAEKTEKGEERETDPMAAYYRNRNVSEFERWSQPLRENLIATSTESELREFYAQQRELLRSDIEVLPPAAEGDTVRIASRPRVLHRFEFLGFVAARAGWRTELDELDGSLLEAFPRDEALVDSICDSRQSFGRGKSADLLFARAAIDPSMRTYARTRLGLESASASEISTADAMAGLLPLLIAGENDRATDLLRRVRVAEVKKEDVPVLEMMFFAALYLGDPLATTTFARHTLRGLVSDVGNYENTQRVAALLKRAKAALDDASFHIVLEGFVAVLRAQKDSFRQYAYTLSSLQESLGRELMTGADVLEMMESCLPDQYYLIPDLAVLAGVESRLEVLQGILPKVPPSNQCEVVLQLLGQLEESAPLALGEYLVGVAIASIEKIDDPQMLTYSMREIGRCSSALAPLVVNLAKALAEKYPEHVEFRVVNACLRRRLGETETALELAREAVESFSGVEQEWNVSQPTLEMMEVFTAAEIDELVRTARAIVQRGGAGHTVFFEKTVAEQRGDHAALQRIADERLAADPESIASVRDAYQATFRSGDIERRMALGASWILLAKDDPSVRESIAQAWIALKNPVRALEVKNAAPQKVADQSARVAKRLEDVTYATLKRDVDAGALEIARTSYRRLWRPYVADEFEGGLIYYSGVSFDPIWPGTEVAAVNDEGISGGLEDLDRIGAEEWKPPVGRAVDDVVAELPFGREELRRKLALLDPIQFRTARTLVKSFAKAEAGARGEAEVVQAWRDSIRDGSGGTLERTLLLSRLEQREGALLGDDLVLLDELVPAVHPLDGMQLRALARLYKKQGDVARASRIYQWCAALATMSFWGDSGGSNISARELIEEVQKELEGPERDAAILAILRNSNPGGEPWERDEYTTFVLRTWRKLVDPATARARCATEIDAVVTPSRGLLRSAAIEATAVLVAAGEFEQAIAAAEIALCKLERSSVGSDPRLRYNSAYLLGGQTLTFHSIRTIVSDLEGAAGAEWCERFAVAVLKWGIADRLSKWTEPQLLARLAARCVENGLPHRARELLERLRAIVQTPADRLYVADVLRLLGDDAAATEIESELLAQRSLHAGRAVEVVDRIAARDGLAAALAAGLRFAEYSTPRRLVVRLEELARELGDRESAERWKKWIVDAETAAKVFEIEW